MSFLQNIKKAIPDEWASKILSGLIPNNLATVVNSIRNKLTNSINFYTGFLSCMAEPMLEIPDEMLEPVFEYKQYLKTFSSDAEFLRGLAELMETEGAEVVIDGVNYTKVTMTNSIGSVFHVLQDSAYNLFYYDGVSVVDFIVDTAELDPDTGEHILRMNYMAPAYHDPEHIPEAPQLYPFPDLISEISENNDLNGLMHDVTGAVLAGKDQVESQLINIIDAFQSRYESVKSLGKTLARGFSTGGIVGLIKVIYEYFKGPASATVDSDGKLVFTELSSITPIVYGSGIISTLLNGVTAIATGIAAAFSPIVGLIVSSIGSLATGIIQSINYAKNNEEHPVVIEDTNTIGSLAPLFLSRAEISLTQLEYDFFFEKYPFIQPDELFSIAVPGGMIIGSISSSKRCFTYEFHPDVIERLEWLDNLNLVSDSHTTVGQDDYYNAYFDFVLNHGASFRTNALNFMYAYMNQCTPDALTGWPTTVVSGDIPSGWSVHAFDNHQFHNDVNTGAMTTGPENRMGAIVAANFFIYFLFLQIIRQSNNDSAYPTVPGSKARIYGYTNGTQDSVTWDRLYLNTNAAGDPISWGTGVSVSRVSTYDNENSFFVSMLLCGYSAIKYFRSGYKTASWSFWFSAATYSGLAYLCHYFDTIFPVAPRSSSTFGYGIYVSADLTRWFCMDFTFTLVFRDDENESPYAFMPLTWIEPISGSLTWFFKTPKYIPGSTIGSLVAAAVITGVIMIAGTIATLSAVKKIKMKRVQLAAKANATWDNFYKNPSDINALKDYRTACLKNNIFTTVYGGSQYSSQGLWASTDSSGGFVSGIASKASQAASGLRDQSAEYCIQDILRLIDPNFQK